MKAVYCPCCGGRTKRNGDMIDGVCEPAAWSGRHAKAARGAVHAFGITSALNDTESMFVILKARKEPCFIAACKARI